MLQAGGIVKIADFGIAKILQGSTQTQTAMVVGSPYYMAPEQLKGAVVSGQTDQYALGTLAYLMLAGRPPFQADTMASLVTQTLFQDPPAVPQFNPALGTPVDDVLRKALAKDPAARYRSCSEFVEALRPACGAPTMQPFLAPVGLAPVVAQATTFQTPPGLVVPPPPVAPPKRSKLPFGIAAALLLAAIGAAGSYFYLKNQPKPAATSEPTHNAVAEVHTPPASSQPAPPEAGHTPAVPVVEPPAAPKPEPKAPPVAVEPPAKKPPAVPCRADLDEVQADKFQPCLDYWTAKSYYPAAFTAYRKEGYPPMLTGSFQQGTSYRITPLLTTEERLARVLEMQHEHYRPESATVLLTTEGPLFTVIWADYPGAIETRSGMSREKLEEMIKAHESDGLRLIDLAGFRFKGPARFSAIWSKRPTSGLASQFDVTEADLADRIRDKSRQGYRVSRLNAYSTVGGVRYAVVWEKWPGDWLCYYNLTHEELLSRQKEAAGKGLRLHHISWFSGHFAGVWWK
jgi:hypothetical protein